MKVIKKILLVLVFMLIEMYCVTDNNAGFINLCKVKVHDVSVDSLKSPAESDYKNISKSQASELNPVLYSSEEDTSIDTIVLRLNNINDIEDLDITENIISIYDNIDTVNVEVPEGVNAEEIIKKYKDSPFVEEAYTDAEVRLFYTPSDPYYSLKQWNLSRINMESAWDVTKGNSSLVVAVLDSGIGPYADIDGLVNGADTSGGTILEDTFPGQYSHEGGFHGTSVASLIASNINSQGIAGIAPDISIMSVKVFPDGLDTTGMSQIAAGIVWAVDHGADVINLSLGTYVNGSVVYDAVNYAVSKGVLLVAATGNDGYVNSICYPAAYDGVIAVGSTSIRDDVSVFSNEGNAIDLVAPGENIYLADNESGSYSSFSGTSFSAPTVAAVAALVKSQYPSYSGHLIEQILYTGTDDIFTNGWDASSGYGIINAKKIMDIAANPYRDSNDTIDSADPISMNKDYIGGNYPALDNDYYKFTLYEPYTVIINVAPTGNQDLGFELYDNTRNMLSMTNANPEGASEARTYTLNKGIYYINIYDILGNASDSAYNIKITANDNTAPKITLIQNSVPLEIGATAVTDVVLSIEDTSYFEVNILRNSEPYGMPAESIFTENGVYKITVSDSSGNVSEFNFNIDKTHPLIVDFNSQGGTEVESTSTLWGSVISEPETPAYSGYTFKGWYKESSCINQWNFDKDAVYSDVTIYAKWSKNVSGVSIEPSSITLNNLGEIRQIIASVSPADAGNKNVIWHSSNTEVVTVSTSGSITAVGNGVATITATTEEGGFTATIETTVQDSSGVYFIKSKNSELFMDIYGGGRDFGTNIIQWSYHGGTNQQWKFENLGNGYYKITSVLNPAYALDVYCSGTSMGTRVIQWPYYGGPNQQWKIIENEDGSISLISKLAFENGTRYVLDVYGGSAVAGVNVIQWSGNGGDNQKWYLEQVRDYTLSYNCNGGTAIASSPE
ncbi:S8 family serine peptidase, partial [Parasporobacterium paucivorans]